MINAGLMILAGVGVLISSNCHFFVPGVNLIWGTPEPLYLLPSALLFLIGAALIDMIVICEPTRRGFEHTTVNAALIAAVANAFQEEELLFLAEAEHIRYVKNILDAHSVVVSYRETTIPQVPS